MSGSDIVARRFVRGGLWRLDWCRNGYCYVVARNGSLVASFVDGMWSDDNGRLPDDVRAIAMEYQP